MGNEKEAKHRLRLIVLARLARLSVADVRRKSFAIVQKLFEDPAYRKAKTLFCYISTGKEVQTRRLIAKALKEGKEVYVPKYAATKEQIFAQQLVDFPGELKKGKYSILAPAGNGKRLRSLKKLDLLILPGMAFDKHKGRLGRGKGAFDFFLAEQHDPSRRIGLAFECQILPRLPIEPHDRVVSRVFTEKRIL